MGQAIQHILVTTDLSEESTRAFPTAVQFAAALGARITVLYVLPAMDVNPISSPFVSPIRPPSDEELLRLADADLEALRPKFPGVKPSRRRSSRRCARPLRPRRRAANSVPSPSIESSSRRS
jgi:nucleotide-binding universal stress UspA family protein